MSNSNHVLDLKHEDGFIEVGDSICGEKHDALAIFEFAKEDRNQLVASDILF